MTLLTHAHIRIALLVAFGLTLLISTRLSSGHLLVGSTYNNSQVAIEPISSSYLAETKVPGKELTENVLAQAATVNEQTAIFVIGSAIANLRSEPTTEASVLLVANQGQQFTITGKSPNLEWIEVCCVNGSKAWIASQLGVIYGSLEQAPIRPFVPSTHTDS